MSKNNRSQEQAQQTEAKKAEVTLASLTVDQRTVFEAWRAAPEQTALLEGTNDEEALGLWLETQKDDVQAAPTGETAEQAVAEGASQEAVKQEPQQARGQTPSVQLVDEAAHQPVTIKPETTLPAVAPKQQEEIAAPVTTEHRQTSNAPVSPVKADTGVAAHLKFARERLTDNQYGAFLELTDAAQSQVMFLLQYVENMAIHKTLFQEEGVAQQERLYRTLVQLLNNAGGQMRTIASLILSIYHANRTTVFDPKYANRYVRNIASLRQSDARLFLNLNTLFLAVSEPNNRKAKTKHMDLVNLLSNVGNEPTLLTQQAKNGLIAFLTA